MSFKDQLDNINQVTTAFQTAYPNVITDVGTFDTVDSDDIPLLLLDYDYVTEQKLGGYGLSDRMEWTYSFLDDKIKIEGTNEKLEQLLQLLSDEGFTVTLVSKMNVRVNDTFPCIGWKVTVR